MALPMHRCLASRILPISVHRQQVKVNRPSPRKRGCCTDSSGKQQQPTRRRIFSAIQPTGVPHLGNYFGALQNWVRLQDDEANSSTVFSVADLHSITLPQPPGALRQAVRDCVAALLACGIDPERSILFQQSSVPQHAELAWILGCKTTLARLGQFPQWKAKSGNDHKKECVGLFTYPVLQSADILLYKTTHVPIGDDQVPHLELTQDLARIFNNNFGQCFPIPKAIGGEISRVRSLRNPAAKMSKSEPDAKGRIELTDSPETVRLKLRKAVTDCTGAVTFDPAGRPGVSNLVALHAAAEGASPREIVGGPARGLQTGEYKMVVAEAVSRRLAPIRERLLELRAAPDHVDRVLKDGAEKAGALAQETYREVRRLVGLSP